MIQFTLSTPPPSLNNATTVVRGRKIKSSQYRKWCDLADKELMAQRGKLPEHCYWAAYILIPGTVRADIDNLIKGVVDAVRRANRIPDDRYCVDLRIRFHASSMVLVAFTEEDLEKWSTIRQASKSKMVKAARSPRLI